MKTRLLVAAAATLLPLSLSGTATATAADTRPVPTNPTTVPDTSTPVKTTVTDPTGDVTGKGTAKQRAATDVTKVVYASEANTTTTDGGRVVRFTVRHGKYLDTANHWHRAVTRFTSGGRQYKAVYAAGNGSLFIKKDGQWQEKDGIWLSVGAGDGMLEIVFPAEAVKGATVADMKTRLRYTGTTLRDRTAKSETPIRLYMIR